MKALFSFSLHSDICRFAPVGSAAWAAASSTACEQQHSQHPKRVRHCNACTVRMHTGIALATDNSQLNSQCWIDRCTRISALWNISWKSVAGAIPHQQEVAGWTLPAASQQMRCASAGRRPDRHWRQNRQRRRGPLQRAAVVAAGAAAVAASARACPGGRPGLAAAARLASAVQIRCHQAPAAGPTPWPPLGCSTHPALHEAHMRPSAWECRPVATT